MPARLRLRLALRSVTLLLALCATVGIARADLLDDVLATARPQVAQAPAAAPSIQMIPPASALTPALRSEVESKVRRTAERTALGPNPIGSFESDVAGRRLGVSVATAGDVNGDGFSDVVAIGVRFNGPTSLFLFLGGASGLTLAPGFPFTTLPEFASMVSGVGDLDGNGLADIAIGFPTSVGGSFRVFYGRNGTLDTANPFVETLAGADGFGQVVGPAGDVNGDGVDDLIVGSPIADNAFSYCSLGASGQVDVYFGAATTGISHTSVWTVLGCIWTGNGTRFGAAVGAAGDVNADGVDDFVIGAPDAKSSTFPNNPTGRVFIVHGSASGLPMDPLRPPLGTLSGATVINGFSDFSSFGATAITAGDVNGDGFSDLAVGAPDEDFGATDAGFVRVFAGSSSGIQSGTLLFQGASGQLNAHLGNVLVPAGDVNGDGRADLLVGQSARVDLVTSTGSGMAQSPSFFLASILELSSATAGDVNGDGLSDVVVGDPGVSNPESSEGRITVFPGRGEGPSLASNWSLTSGFDDTNMGWSVSTAGDVNGDGFDDMLTGALTIRNVSTGETNCGGVFLNYGNLNGPTPGFSDWSFIGSQDDQLGIVVATAGDINGDGFSDIVAGAQQDGAGNGKTLIWYGRSGGLVGGAAPNLTLTGPSFNSQFGAMLCAGDFNGDGYADLAVGAPNATSTLGMTTHPQGGEVFIYLGSAIGLNGTPAMVLEGVQDGEQLGSSLAADADVNGDGFTDLVASAPGFDGVAGADAGRFGVWLGGVGAPPLALVNVLIGAQAGFRLGHHLAHAGDVNGDGLGDIIAGMPFVSSTTGRAEVYAGTMGGSGLLPTAIWAQDGFQVGSAFGSSVAGAGDVDGDGLSDVIVGSVFEDVAFQMDCGAARVFLGPLTPFVPAKWSTASPLAFANFGHVVANAGDVNGDGWSDLLVGSPAASGTFFRQGLSDLFLGAGAIGKVHLAIPLRPDGKHIPTLGLAGPSSFNLFAIGGSPAGRTKIRMQWRSELPPKLVGPPVTGVQSAFTLTNAPGTLGSVALLNQSVTGLAPGGPYSWRARTLTRSIYFPTTAWNAPAVNGAREYDLRTPGSWVGVDDAPARPLALRLAAPWPNPTSNASSVTFDLPSAGPVSLDVLDLQGRKVRSLVHGTRAAGRQQASWDGRDESGRPAAAGVYFYRLATGQAIMTQRVALLR